MSTAEELAVASLLSNAADHLDEVGLHQGSLLSIPGLQPWHPAARDIPCCGFGAVQVERHSRGEEIVVAEAAQRFLDAFVQDSGELGNLDDYDDFDGDERPFPFWNDIDGRTKEEVVAFLRAASDHVRKVGL